jgi:hypothetical protein
MNFPTGARVEASGWTPASYLLIERNAMLKCEHCASRNVRWFTPRQYANRAAVLLCMGCRRLTIVAPSARRAALAEAERAA